MTDHDENPTSLVETRRRPDLLTIVVGVLTLAMAVAAFAGRMPDLSGLDPRWVLAGGAGLIGVLLLVGSLRKRH